jgi:hypothetical protein
VRPAQFLLSLLLLFAAEIADVAVVRAADVSHEIGRIRVEELNEISGLAASRLNPDVLWLHNDGDSGQLFGVSTSGRLAAWVRCNVRVKDLEEVAIGPGPARGIDYLYLGDIGDNDERRREIRIVRFPEPNLGGRRGVQIEIDDADEIRLRYSDGPHDAETMVVDPANGDLFIVTKEKDRARLYTIPGTALTKGAQAELRLAGELNVELVSAGSISRDGRRILLRRERVGWLWSRAAEETVAEALARKPVKVQVLGKRQGPNGEAIGFAPDGRSYFTVSEGKKQSIYRFELSPLE